MGELSESFYGIYLFCEAAEYSSLVSAAGADFEDFAVGVEAQLLGHQGDDVWLGDGLVASDRQRAVGVGLGAIWGRHKFFSADLKHHSQDIGVGDVAAL